MDNVIKLASAPGMILVLHTDKPVPPAGYKHLAAMAEAGMALAETIADAQQRGGDDSGA